MARVAACAIACLVASSTLAATLERGQLRLGQFATHVGDQFEQVHLDASAARAGDQFRLGPAAQAEAAEQFLAVFDLIHRVGGVADADGVADAVR